MFVTENQIFVFFACVAIGGMCGIFFSVAYFLKRIVKTGVFAVLFDVIAFACTAFLYAFAAFTLKFPSYRLYMTAGVLIGIFFYMESFHILLALCAEKLYNIFVIKLRALKSKRKARVKDDENEGNGRKRKSNGRKGKRIGREV